MVSFACPFCGTTIHSPEAKPDTTVRCPKCAGTVRVPAARSKSLAKPVQAPNQAFDFFDIIAKDADAKQQQHQTRSGRRWRLRFPWRPFLVILVSGVLLSGLAFAGWLIYAFYFVDHEAPIVDHPFFVKKPSREDIAEVARILADGSAEGFLYVYEDGRCLYISPAFMEQSESWEAYVFRQESKRWVALDLKKMNALGVRPASRLQALRLLKQILDAARFHERGTFAWPS
ncbi:MAG: hypothetical protein KatS3mg105_3858 [Gemmatales bacterium]|nr:MAG: hypothetical protein KatS3mg105_3858 [Gemmatales bacterium]